MCLSKPMVLVSCFHGASHHFREMTKYCHFVDKNYKYRKNHTFCVFRQLQTELKRMRETDAASSMELNQNDIMYREEGNS